MRDAPHLPFRITLCAVVVLTTAAWNLVRLLTSIAWGGLLESYAPRAGAVYIGISGGVWSAAGGFVLWGVWRRTQWALRALLAGAWSYSAWAWFDRILLQAGGPANWGFALICTLVLLGFITAIALSPRSRTYFGEEAHEREEQDQSSA